MRYRLFILTLAAALLTGCAADGDSSKTSTASPTNDDSSSGFTVTVDFLKVGKADAAVISTGEHIVVIDCGEESDGSKVCKCLDSLDAERVDELILTHYDKDHIGGAAQVVEDYEVSHVIGADYTEESAEYTKLDAAMNDKEIKWEFLKDETMSFTLDDTDFEIYPCEQEKYSDGNDNNHSLVIKMTHLDDVFLFAADAMQERLDEIMEIGDCDLLKEPYHGREIANLGEFLDKVSPEYAVVSTNKDNYSEVTEQTLEERGIKTFVTFRDGNIRCTSTGNSLAFETGVSFDD